MKIFLKCSTIVLEFFKKLLAKLPKVANSGKGFGCLVLKKHLINQLINGWSDISGIPVIETIFLCIRTHIQSEDYPTPEPKIYVTVWSHIDFVHSASEWHSQVGDITNDVLIFSVEFQSSCILIYCSYIYLIINWKISFII